MAGMENIQKVFYKPHPISPKPIIFLGRLLFHTVTFCFIVSFLIYIGITERRTESPVCTCSNATGISSRCRSVYVFWMVCRCVTADRTYSQLLFFKHRSDNSMLKSTQRPTMTCPLWQSWHFRDFGPTYIALFGNTSACQVMSVL